MPERAGRRARVCARCRPRACAATGNLQAAEQRLLAAADPGRPPAPRGGGRIAVSFCSGASAVAGDVLPIEGEHIALRRRVRRAAPHPRARPTRMGATCAPGASALRSRNEQRTPKRIAGERQHAPQLTRADHTDAQRLQGLRGSGLLSTAAVCACPKCIQRGAYFGEFVGKDRGREQRGVLRSGGADGEGRDRYPARHLRDRQAANRCRSTPWIEPARRAPARRSWPRSCPADAPRRRRPR